MTSICVPRIKSIIIDSYLDNMNPTLHRTQIIKNTVYLFHFIIIINQIICYFSKDEQVSLLLVDLARFIGGIRLYSTIIIILLTLLEATLVKYFYVIDDNIRIYWTEMLEIFRRPTKLRLLIPFQNLVRTSSKINKMVKIFHRLMLLVTVNGG